MPAGPGTTEKSVLFSPLPFAPSFSPRARAILLKCDLANLDGSARHGSARLSTDPHRVALPCAVTMNEDGRLFYTVIRRVAIRINDAAVTNDVFVIFQLSIPFFRLRTPFASHRPPSARRPSFRGVSGVKIHEGEQSRRRGKWEKKSDKREGSAAERARVGKINCDRRCTAIKSVLTGPWRSRDDSMFKQQIAHRRFMNARRQVPFDIRIRAGTNEILILSSRNWTCMETRIMLQHAFRNYRRFYASFTFWRIDKRILPLPP